MIELSGFNRSMQLATTEKELKKNCFNYGT